MLGEDDGPVRSGVNAFERLVMSCKVEKEPSAYKLAKAAAKTYENLYPDKIAEV